MRDTQRGVAKVDPCLSRSKRPLKSIVSSTSVQVQVFRVATPSESEGHHVGTETKRHKKCFTGALGKSRKSGDCKRRGVGSVLEKGGQGTRETILPEATPTN